MPIKGLTENRRLPRVGKLYLGIKVKGKGGKEHPKAVDYIVCPETLPNGDPNPNRADFVKVFGEQPRSIRIMFPVDNEDVVLSQYYRAYSSSRGLVCKGDGEQCRRMVDAETGDLANRDSRAVEWKVMPCGGVECPDYLSKPQRCREVMNLQFMIPELPGMGIWQIDTSSINTIKNLNGSAAFVKGIYGRLAFIPLILQMEQIQVTPEDGKKKKVWVLSITTPTNLADSAKLATQSRVQLMAAMGPRLLLPTPDDEAPDLVTEDADASESKFEEGPDYDFKTGKPVEESVTAADVAAAEKDASDLFPVEGSKGESAKETPPAVAPVNNLPPSHKKAAAKEGTYKPPPPGNETVAEPSTFEELIALVKAQGSSYTESWLFRNLGMSVDEAKADPALAWRTISELAGW